MIERRKAIVGLAAIFAVAMGRRGTAQQAEVWTGRTSTTSTNSISQTPQWFMFAIEEGGGLKFEYKGETVSITADELWTALKA